AAGGVFVFHLGIVDPLILLLLHADLPDHRDHRRRRQLLGRRGVGRGAVGAARGAALLGRFPHGHLRRDPGGGDVRHADRRRGLATRTPARPHAGVAGSGAAEMSALLQLSDLRKAYAGVHALDGVSFDVEAGSITGLIGPNGSGKSTAIDCISGFQRLDAGRDITGRSAHVIARAGLMRTFQTVRVYERLSLRDNLAIATQQFDRASWLDEFLRTRKYRDAVDAAESRSRELVELIGLQRYYEAEAGILSYGQKKLVALAAALMPRPKIVVLDEPVAGVNPSRIREVEAALRQLNQAGETFLIVEHNVEFITNLCHRVIVLEQGRKLAEGTAAEIHADSRVLEAYLGTTPEIAAAEMRGAAA